MRYAQLYLLQHLYYARFFSPPTLSAMPTSAPQVHTGRSSSSTSSGQVSAPRSASRTDNQRSRTPITDRLVASTLTWTMLDLEERLIPSQGVGDILYVYAGDTVVTHDIRRTLKVFEGDAEEAITNIRTFVLEGILGTPGASC